MDKGFFTAVGLLGLLCAGCTQQTRPLSLPEVQSQTSMLGPQVSADAAAQAYVLGEVIDARQNPEYIGLNLTGGEKMLGLLQEELLATQPGAIALLDTSEEAAPTPRIDLRLRKAYLSFFATTMQGTVVIEVTVSEPDGQELFSRNYRGQEVVTVFFGSDYIGVLREAFEQAFKQIWQDLQYPPLDEVANRQ